MPADKVQQMKRLFPHFAANGRNSYLSEYKVIRDMHEFHAF